MKWVLGLSAGAACAAIGACSTSDAGDDSAAGSTASDAYGVTPLYGGGTLIFDEFGRLKYWVHKDVFSEHQSERLAYLWNEGYLVADRGAAKYRPARFSTIHLRRALDAQRRPAEEW